jgi:hypothetical protein
MSARPGAVRRSQLNMAVPSKSIIDTRHDQMFPNLEASEVERVRRFGEVHHLAPAKRWRVSATSAMG